MQNVYEETQKYKDPNNMSKLTPDGILAYNRECVPVVIARCTIEISPEQAKLICPEIAKYVRKQSHLFEGLDTQKAISYAEKGMLPAALLELGIITATNNDLNLQLVALKDMRYRNQNDIFSIILEQLAYGVIDLWSEFGCAWALMQFMGTVCYKEYLPPYNEVKALWRQVYETLDQTNETLEKLSDVIRKQL